MTTLHDRTTVQINARTFRTNRYTSKPNEKVHQCRCQIGDKNIADNDNTTYSNLICKTDLRFSLKLFNFLLTMYLLVSCPNLKVSI